MPAPRARNEHGTFEYIVDAEADLATIIEPKASEFALAMAEGTIHYHTGTIWQEIGGGSVAGLAISRGGTFFSSTGITSGANIIVWRVPFVATVTKVYGFRVGGSGATVNARRNETDTFLASDLSLTSANQWMDGGSVQNTTLVAGDELEIQVVSASGSPTEVAVQVDLTRT